MMMVPGSAILTYIDNIFFLLIFSLYSRLACTEKLCSLLGVVAQESLAMAVTGKQLL